MNVRVKTAGELPKIETAQETISLLAYEGENPGTMDVSVLDAFIQARIGPFTFADTLTDLQAITGNEGDVGFVLDDGANTGSYKYTAGAWVKQSDLPLGFQNIADTTLYEFTNVAGTSGAYTATAPIPRATIEDGTPRMFVFIPHVDGIPDPSNSNRITLQVSDDGSPNLMRTADDKNPVAGQLIAGQRYLILADGARYYITSAFGTVTPTSQDEYR